MFILGSLCANNLSRTLVLLIDLVKKTENPASCMMKAEEEEIAAHGGVAVVLVPLGLQQPNV